MFTFKVLPKMVLREAMHGEIYIKEILLRGKQHCMTKDL